MKDVVKVNSCYLPLARQPCTRRLICLCLSLLGAMENTKPKVQGFPGGSVVENLPANAGVTGLTADPGRPHLPWSN